MSHIVTIQTQLHDPRAITAACQRLGLPDPVPGQAQLFAGPTAEGLLVQLPGWKYPLAIETQTGQLQHDNFQGHWGDIAQLHHFLQAYAIEVVRSAARQQGYTVSEQPLEDGSVQLRLTEGS